MKWITPKFGYDFPKEDQTVLGRYSVRVESDYRVFYVVLKFTLDDGRAHWVNTSTDDDEGEPDAWCEIED